MERGNCKTPRPRKIDDFESVCRDRGATRTSPPRTYSREKDLGAERQNGSKGRFCWGGEFCNSLESQNFGKWFIYIGLGLVLIGLLIWFGSKLGVSFGKLPGDIHVHKEKFSFYFPIMTSIIVSIVLNIIFWFLRK